ncbi:MAG TPA: class I SAM-dependent methyltransferase [Acidobacteriaceae bacterium]|nr:class I SAM-dependent methyltransferase [Acidobacteriaceae bacterium]
MHERRFRPSQMHRLEDPQRKNWLPPREILACLGLQAGWTVADIGAGTGYFTLPIAAALGSAGHVFAADVAPEMLARLREKIAEAAVPNVECVEAEASATTLPSASCDCVLLANIWHEFDDHSAVLAEMGRVLRPGGQITLLDWRPDVEPVHGPPLEHRISAESARQSLAQSGFASVPSARLFPFSWLLTGARS